MKMKDWRWVMLVTVSQAARLEAAPSRESLQNPEHLFWRVEGGGQAAKALMTNFSQRYGRS